MLLLIFMCVVASGCMFVQTFIYSSVDSRKDKHATKLCSFSKMGGTLCDLRIQDFPSVVGAAVTMTPPVTGTVGSHVYRLTPSPTFVFFLSFTRTCLYFLICEVEDIILGFEYIQTF